MESSQELYYLTHAAQEVQLCPGVRRLTHRLAGGAGVIWCASPYPGVELIACDFRMAKFALPYMQEYPYLKLNYCTGGRCEVPLDNSRYAYLENGVLSADLNQSLGALLLPTGHYQGLEAVLNLDLLARQPPQAWQECGVALQDVRLRLASRAGSIRLRPSSQWDALARQLAARLREGALTPEAARFHLLQLLYLLKDGEGMEEITSSTLLTRGQHALAEQAEQRLTADLSARISIEDLAAGLGISASALKKYFGQVYGKPISLYLREKRVERAKRLLAQSSQSVNDIALAVGYQNQGKFGAVFRDATGTTPSEYRRLCRAGQIHKGADEHEII